MMRPLDIGSLELRHTFSIRGLMLAPVNVPATRGHHGRQVAAVLQRLPEALRAQAGGWAVRHAGVARSGRDEVGEAVMDLRCWTVRNLQSPTD